MLKTISLLGVNVSRVNLVLAVRQICAWVGQKQRTYVCVAPVATLVDARRDPLYAASGQCGRHGHTRWHAGCLAGAVAWLQRYRTHLWP